MQASELRDRELLELAAKAGGIDLHWNDAGESGYYENWSGMPQWMSWNPLTDDGDALRLTVKLGGELLIHTEEHWSAFGMIYSDEGMFEYHNGDPYAATRRAIVRAAAEIGSDSNDR